MNVGEFLKTSLFANRAAEEGVHAEVIKMVGDIEKNEGRVDGRSIIGKYRRYNIANADLKEAKESGAFDEDDIKEFENNRTEAAQEYNKSAGGKDIESSMRKTVGADYAELQKGNANVLNDHTNKYREAMKRYKENMDNDPETLKDAFNNLKEVNALRGKGTVNSVADTAFQYFTGGDLNAAYKAGKISGTEAIGMGALRGATALGGTAVTIGGVKAVGRAVFGSSNNNYSY